MSEDQPGKQGLSPSPQGARPSVPDANETQQGSHCYSSDVVLSLVVGDRTIPLSHVAPNFVILKQPIDMPPCTAEVLVDVNGDVLRRRVILANGIQTATIRTMLAPHDGSR